MSTGTRLGVVGCGLITGRYIRSWLEAHPSLEVPVIADVSADGRRQLAGEIAAVRGTMPIEVESAKDMVTAGAVLDAAYIATPHGSHLEDAGHVLRHGIDLLIEKPLARTRPEAERIMSIPMRPDQHVVVAYQGSLSPLMARAAQTISDGTLGEVKAIHGAVWQNWKPRFSDNWRQVPEISGGGFLIDTGAHLLNALCHVMGGAPGSVCAISDMTSTRLEFVTGFMGHYSSGVPVAVVSCGDSYPTCEGWLEFIFSGGRMRLECWGRWLEIQTGSEAPPHRWEADSIRGPMDAFLAIREGRMENPSPMSRSLEVAALHDAIIRSAFDKGAWKDIRADYGCDMTEAAQ